MLGVLVFSAAMQMRYEKLHDICNRYSDVMRPESLMQKIIPKMEAFKWHVPTGTAVCTPVGVGHKAIAALFERIRTGDMHDANMFQSLKDNFEGANRNFKKAIIVRHPMERLLSIYRYVLICNSRRFCKTISYNLGSGHFIKSLEVWKFNR